jgi:predicted MFS family arabinose efflux permease
LALVLFVNRTGTMVVPFMTLYLTSELEMSEASAGRMISVHGVGAVCGAYLGGWLAHRFGAIRVQTSCMFLAAPLYWTIGLWTAWPAIALNLFVLSVVGEGVRTANATSIAAMSSGENRTRAFALNRLAANLGFSIGPVVGGVLSEIDYSLLFLADAGTTLLAALALLAFFRMRRDPVVDEAAAPTSRVSALHDRVFLAVCGLFLVSLAVFFQATSTYPLYLRDHYGLSNDEYGQMWMINTLGIVAFEMVLLDAIKHWPLLRTIGCGCFLTCLGFGILPLTDSVLFAVLAMVVVTVGEMLSFSLSAGFIAGRAPRGSEATYMTWYTSTFALAAVLGPTIGAAIYEAHPDALWYGALATGVFVLAGFWLVASREGDAAEVGALPQAAASALAGDVPEPPAQAVEPLEAAVMANAARVP